MAKMTFGDSPRKEWMSMLITQKQTDLGDFFAVLLAWVRQIAEEQSDDPSTKRANHLFKTCYMLNTLLLRLPNPSFDVLVMIERLETITPKHPLRDYNYQLLLVLLDQWAAVDGPEPIEAAIITAGRQLMADVKAFVQPNLVAGLQPKGGRNPKNRRSYLRLRQRVEEYINELTDELLDREDRVDPEANYFLVFLGSVLAVKKLLEGGSIQELKQLDQLLSSQE